MILFKSSFISLLLFFKKSSIFLYFFINYYKRHKVRDKVTSQDELLNKLRNTDKHQSLSLKVSNFNHSEPLNNNLKIANNCVYGAFCLSLYIFFVSSVANASGIKKRHSDIASIQKKELKINQDISKNNKNIGDIRIGNHDGFTRFVLEINRNVKTSLIQSSKTREVKIILNDANIDYFNIKDDSFINSPFNSISSSVSKKQKNTTISFELKKDVKILNSFPIEKDNKNGYRYVVDISNSHISKTLDSLSNIIKIVDESEDLELTKQNTNFKINSNPSLSSMVISEALKQEDDLQNNEIEIKKLNKKQNIAVVYNNTKPVIVIDAGHGGADPGAIGSKYKTREKDITVRYALLVYAKLKETGKYYVKLTRSSDKTVDLKTRRDIAGEHNADLFISIHADHHPNKNTNGLSIYTLSNQSSDEVAKRLAEEHDEGQIIGGIKFYEKNPDLSKIIVDLERGKSSSESIKFAELALDEMKKRNIKTLFKNHRFAGFAVLKGLDVPSVLIETGFLSNKYEEGMLRSTFHKQKVTDAIVESVEKYFAKDPRVNTLN